MQIIEEYDLVLGENMPMLLHFSSTVSSIIDLILASPQLVSLSESFVDTDIHGSDHFPGVVINRCSSLFEIQISL